MPGFEGEHCLLRSEWLSSSFSCQSSVITSNIKQFEMSNKLNYQAYIVQSWDFEYIKCPIRVRAGIGNKDCCILQYGQVQLYLKVTCATKKKPINIVI